MGNATSDETPLMDLTLEELMTVRSSVAGKVPEKSAQVPGTVWVATAETMERHGLYTVADLADITPGYSSYTVFGERVLSTRGQKAGSFNNNKHLLLVDGIPVNHAKGYKASTEYELPLFMAEQVEFLSGPSSALYGTSAFLGVVSVVPKRLELPGSLVESRVGLGTPGFERRALANLLHRDTSTSTSINLGYTSRYATADAVGAEASALQRNWDDQDSIFLRLAHESVSGASEGLGAGLIYMDKTGGLGEFWTGDFSSELNELRWTTLVPYVRFQRDVSRVLGINAYVKYNLSREKGVTVPFDRAAYEDYDGTGPVFASYDQFVNDVEASVELRVHRGRRFELITGYSFDTRAQSSPADEGHSRVVEADQVPPLTDDVDVESPRVTTLSAYAQVRSRLPVFHELSLIGGARLDSSLTADEQFIRLSPRVGIVQQFVESFALKALYSTALRAPGIKEYGLNEEARATLRSTGGDVDGIRTLGAETTESFELAAVYSSERIRFEASGFSSNTSDALNGVRYEGQNIFANGSEAVQTVGLTLDASASVAPGLELLSNYAYSTPVDDSIADEVPEHDFHAGASYLASWAANVRATVWVRWVSGYYLPDKSMDTSPGFARIDANLLVPATERLRVELLGRNLLGSTEYYPFGGVRQVPLPQRTLMLSLVYHSQ